MERKDHSPDPRLPEKPVRHPQEIDASQQTRATPWELARERVMHPNQPVTLKH